MTKKKLHSKNAYFIAPLYASPTLGEAYFKIVKTLSDHGFDVYDDVTKTTPSKMVSDKSTSVYLSKAETAIKQSDIFVAELTEPSPSVGYEVGYAIANNKPVLILRNENAGEISEGPFITNSSKLITVIKYNKDNLQKKIEKFLRKAERGIFVKRLPIEFTKEQVEFINKLKIKLNKRSFNSTVRKIIDDAIVNDSST